VNKILSQTKVKKLLFAIPLTVFSAHMARAEYQPVHKVVCSSYTCFSEVDQESQMINDDDYSGRLPLGTQILLVVDHNYPHKALCRADPNTKRLCCLGGNARWVCDFKENPRPGPR